MNSPMILPGTDPGKQCIRARCADSFSHVVNIQDPRIRQRTQPNIPMKVNRRQFFTAAGVAGAVAALPRTAEAVSLIEWTPTARLRLSCQEGVAPGSTLAEKLDFLEGLGFEGFEPGGGGLAGRVEELQKALQGRKIKISAICAGFQGCPISEKEEERTKAIQTSKEILTAAGALGSTGMILVPAFNGQTKLEHKESRELLV
jgi:hypothetical protein